VSAQPTPIEGASPPAPSLQVVATAGHVDHGKSALILRLTGIDPDRLAEEKRRGLTIDLGFAWTTLPSGREIGFVDVPGHERFVRNMLAGVGPVRLVLFVVAADEGWKPQSEEHAEIVDVLGVDGAVVALTKLDTVDAATLAERTTEVKARLRGTRLEDAPLIPCSAVTGEGIDALIGALDDLVAQAPPPERASRPRQFIDRVFTIKGAGTVVTGTLTGGPLAVGQEAQVLPSGHRARIRGLQTHKRSLDTAYPVSRVAVNLAGTPKEDLTRGDVLTLPGQWRPVSVFGGVLWPVRGLDHPLASRGAYKLHVGSAERDVRIQFLSEERRLTPPADGAPATAYVRVTLDRPLVLDLGDSFVVREVGRRETVAGGRVLDVDPTGGPAADQARWLATLDGLPRIDVADRMVRHRGALRASRLQAATGVGPDEMVRRGILRLGDWLVSADLVDAAGRAVATALAAHHADRPLSPGVDVVDIRALLSRDHEALADGGLADAVIDRLASAGAVEREGAVMRLPGRRPSTAGREDADRLVAAVAAGDTTPPTVRELIASGFTEELIRATAGEGRLVRISPDIVITADLLARAESIIRARAGPPGLTVSRFREALGTSRRFALPILEYFDAKGITRRQGDVRLLRSGPPQPAT
jgi:selenocysteine-specific elongation factor